MKEYITMGKVTNIDFKSLSNWLSSEEGSKYFDWNWSPQATGWDKSEKINFYEKQMKLPKFSMIENFYDQMKDPWLREEKIKALQDRANYLKSINQSFDLIYQDLEHAFQLFEAMRMFGYSRIVFLRLNYLNHMIIVLFPNLQSCKVIT